MHELSIAESILDHVHRAAEREGLARVAAVGVEIGHLSGVLPDALQFCFEAIVRGTADAALELRIEEVPVCVACRDCGDESVVEDLDFRCAACGTRDVEVMGGMDMRIVWLDAVRTESRDPEVAPT